MAQHILLSVCVCAVVAVVGCWEDPVPVLPTVTVIPDLVRVVTGHVGDEVEFHCSATNTSHSYGYATWWYQIRGNQLVKLTNSYGSECNLKKKLMESDSGTTIYCRVNEKPFETETGLYEFVANSKPIDLIVTQVDGTYVAPLEWTPLKAPTITITPAPGAAVSQYKVGDEVQFTCRSENMPLGREMIFFQVKDDLEIARKRTTTISNVTELTLVTTVTLTDDSTKLYCWMWFTTETNSLMIKSDYITLSVSSGDGSTTADIFNINDSDHLFLASLLPDMKKIPENQKIFAKGDIIQVIQNYQPYQSEQDTPTSTYNYNIL